jgi:hypothetical protein
MPTLQLVSTEAILHVRCGDDFATFAEILKPDEERAPTQFNPQVSTTFSMWVRPEGGSFAHVRLSTGEKFHELKGSVTLRPVAEIKAEPVGMLSYFPAREDDIDPWPASYAAEVRVLQEQFHEIILAARAGRLPSTLLISVGGPGAKMGWEPDGSGTEWDNKEHRNVLIYSLTLSVPLVGEPPNAAENDPVDEHAAEMLPPLRAQLTAIGKHMQELDAKLGRLTQHVTWLAVGLAAVLLWAR